MALIPATVTQLDAYSRIIAWYVVNGGDTCEPVRAWAYEIGSWQLTGYAQGGVITNPNVPVEPDRSFNIHGSNDGSCFGLMFNIAADPAGMASRLEDPIRNGTGDQRFVWLLPKVLGARNPAGGDCSLLLFQARMFGPRG